jgi:hypothetical protein
MPKRTRDIRTFAWNTWTDVLIHLALHIFSYLNYMPFDPDRHDRFQLGVTCKSMVFLIERMRYKIGEYCHEDHKTVECSIMRALSCLDYGPCIRIFFQNEELLIAYGLERPLQLILKSNFFCNGYDVDKLVIKCALTSKRYKKIYSTFRFEVDGTVPRRNHTRRILGPCLYTVISSYVSLLADDEFDIEKDREKNEQSINLHQEYLACYLLMSKKDVFKRPFTNLEEFKKELEVPPDSTL